MATCVIYKFFPLRVPFFITGNVSINSSVTDLSKYLVAVVFITLTSCPSEFLKTLIADALYFESSIYFRPPAESTSTFNTSAFALVTNTTVIPNTKMIRRAIFFIFYIQCGIS